MRNFSKILAGLALLVLLLIGADRVGRMFYESAMDSVIFTREELKEAEGTIETLLVGNSLIHWGMDPHIVEEKLDTICFNMGSSAQSIAGSYYIIKDQLEKNPVNRIFLALSVQLLLTDEEVTDARLPVWDRLMTNKVKLEYLLSEAEPKEWEQFLFYPCRVDNVLNFTQIERNVSYKKTELFKARQTFPGAKYTYYGKGFETRRRSFDGETVEHLWSYGIWDETRIKEKNVEYLNKIVDLCGEKNVELNFIVFPHAKEFADMQGDLSAMDQYLTEFCKKTKTGLYNYNYTAYEGVYEIFTEKHFQDQKHFNLRGSELFTEMLCDAYLEKEQE